MTRKYKLTGIKQYPEEDSDFYVDIDIQRRVHIVWVNETMMDSGEEIVIYIDKVLREAQQEAIEEYKRNNKIAIGKTK